MGYFKKFGMKPISNDELWTKYKNIKFTDFLDEIVHFVQWINPTVVLTATLSFLWLCIMSAAMAAYQLPAYFLAPLIVLQIAVNFMFFTVFHDGSHGSASKNRSLNELLMLPTWVALLGNPWFFRRVHMRHHANTNVPVKDPDHFTASPQLWKRILKSSILMVYYHWYAYKMGGDWKHKFHLVTSSLGPVLVVALAVFTPFTWPILLVWLFPAWAALALLSYFNTAWPHHPAQETSRYKLGSNQFVPWWAQFALLNQNLHLLHHVRPNLPWYRYPSYFRAHRDDFEAKGAPLKVHTKRQEPFELVPTAFKEACQRLWDSLGSPRF